MKLNISLDDELVKRIDVYADHHYMSRSGLISYVMAVFLSKNDADIQVKEINDIFNECVSDNPDLSEIREEMKTMMFYANNISRA